jgi:Virulence-associated protein E/Bifunctional DNA primase/polymerase, N-terminal
MSESPNSLTPLNPVLEAALRYTKQGVAVTPVHYMTKKAVDGWDVTDLSPQDLPHLFQDKSNIGAILGEKSAGVADGDLDCPEAVALAPSFLPTTGARFGRQGKRNSHWLYLSDLHESEDRAAIQCRDPVAGQTLVELRIGGGGKAAQTVMPPSVHETGEVIEWEPGCSIEQIVHVDGAELKFRFAKLMAATLLARRWQEGARNGAANALAGWLARLGWTEEEAAGFIEAIASTAGDDEIKMRVRAVRDTYKKFEARKQVTGLPKLKELLGADTVSKAAEWLAPGGGLFPDLTQHGRPKPTLPNTKVALTLLGVECRHDLFKLRYLVNGHEIESFVGEMSDPALLRLRELIYEKSRFDATTQTVETAVRTLANHHQFHPVRDYLDGLVWDRVSRIDRWLATYGGAEDTEYVRAVGALVLVAAVRRVRQPGCKFDEMVVLESEQGRNKSKALEILAVEPEWFTDNLPLGLPAKETIEALSGHWIIEVSELQGMRKSDIDKVKAFLSRNTDRARMAYDRTVTEARRQCVIIGTTNSEQYLRDLTGNRRFWPVRIERFDLETLKRDRDQLWAEAAAREARGDSIRLPESLWTAAAAEQRHRVVENPFVSILESMLRDPESKAGPEDDPPPMEGRIDAEDAWTAVGLPPGRRRTQDDFEKLGDAFKQLGWERTRLRVGGGERSYVYVKGNKPYRRIYVELVGIPPKPYANYEDRKREF